MLEVMDHPSLPTLEAALVDIRSSPPDDGRVELIVVRPAENEREVVEEAVIDLERGVIGDDWQTRGSTSTDDGASNPLKQVNLMNHRVVTHLAGGDADRRKLAGDQLYVDLDLSLDNLPPGTRIQVGSAVLEITEPWHKGCAKFSQRFGADALRFVRSPVGRQLSLRGVHTKVIEGGTVRTGDRVRKLTA
jgi:hypothetical protein